MTRREFLKTPEMKVTRILLRVCVFWLYIMAAISLVTCIYLMDEFIAVVDTVFIFAMALLIHLLQSRIAAILLAVYFVALNIINIIRSGAPAGLGILIPLILALIITFKFQSAWKKQKNKSEDPVVTEVQTDD